jgi:hypothetical protein
MRNSNDESYIKRFLIFFHIRLTFNIKFYLVYRNEFVYQNLYVKIKVKQRILYMNSTEPHNLEARLSKIESHLDMIAEKLNINLESNSEREALPQTSS